jgi:hypothetical protein
VSVGAGWIEFWRVDGHKQAPGVASYRPVDRTGGHADGLTSVDDLVALAQSKPGLACDERDDLVVLPVDMWLQSPTRRDFGDDCRRTRGSMHEGQPKGLAGTRGILFGDSARIVQSGIRHLASA